MLFLQLCYLFLRCSHYVAGEIVLSIAVCYHANSSFHTLHRPFPILSYFHVRYFTHSSVKERPLESPFALLFPPSSPRESESIVIRDLVHRVHGWRRTRSPSRGSPIFHVSGFRASRCRRLLPRFCPLVIFLRLPPGPGTGLLHRRFLSQVVESPCLQRPAHAHRWRDHPVPRSMFRSTSPGRTDSGPGRCWWRTSGSTWTSTTYRSGRRC